jgi:isoprenylcysteine carboxyl methyltransferase (ICMT) family protein YpbQ
MENEENCLKRVNSKYGQSSYQLGLVLLVFFYSAAIITAKASDKIILSLDFTAKRLRPKRR